MIQLLPSTARNLVPLVAAACTFIVTTANAWTVDYAVTPLGTNTWRYDYTLDNTVPGIAFDELTVFFDVGQSGLLGAAVAPAGWDAIIVQPDSGIPADGFFDVLHLPGPLSGGARVGGFSVTFAYLGTGTPGGQRFDWIDSSSFSVVHSGVTTPIPEPATYQLALLGLLWTAAMRLAPGRLLAGHLTQRKA